MTAKRKAGAQSPRKRGGGAAGPAKRRAKTEPVKAKRPKTKAARAPAKRRAPLDQVEVTIPRWHLIPKPATRRRRVEHIADIMALGEWITRHSTKALAEHWGMSYAAVEADASRASKVVRRAHGKRLEFVTGTIAKLGRVFEGAMRYGQFSAAVRACEAMLRVHGPPPAGRGRGAAPGVDEAAPAGLPPELARLDPKPSVDELRHFVEVTAEACPVEGCRVHRPPPADAPLH